VPVETTDKGWGEASQETNTLSFESIVGRAYEISLNEMNLKILLEI
jgi:hypothetical protein